MLSGLFSVHEDPEDPDDLADLRISNRVTQNVLTDINLF